MTLPPSIKGHRVVGGIGPKHPKFIIVGESLGADEEEKGIPFCGTDGQILDGMLNSAGILRSECYITNVIKIRPPANKVKRLGEYGLSGLDFIPILKEELNEIDCPIIIPLGNVAYSSITGLGIPPSGDVCFSDGIGKHRGSIYASQISGRLCIPTYNPGFVRELWQARGTVVADFRKAIRIRKEGYYPISFSTLTRPTIPDISSFLDLIERSTDRFSVDIESYKTTKQISCIGIAATLNGHRMSICIPIKNGLLNYWDLSDEQWVWQRLRRLFQNDRLLKIGQFLNFDFTMLERFVGEFAPPWFDLNIAHHTLDPELPHTLAYLTSIYTDIPYYKDDTKEEGVGMWTAQTPTERLWDYNGKDVEGPLIIEPKLTQELKDEGLLDFFYGFAMPKMRALMRVQWRGMLVDQRKREILSKWRHRQASRSQQTLNTLVGYDLNVSSPKQVMNFLYNELKLPPQYHRKSKQLTANEEALTKLQSKFPLNRSFGLMMDLRGLYKEIGTYLESPISEDGRCRSTYNSTGTETGRSSCKKTCFGDGMDLQNVPETIRGMFIAGPNNIYLKYDLWQAEAYVVAILSNCLSFLDRLKRGVKIYPMVASWLFDCPEEEIDINDNSPTGKYGKAKRVVHGGNYGLGPQTMANLLQQTMVQAKAHLSKYFLHAPEIQQWHLTTQEQLKSTRRLVTPFGRIRYFRNRLGEDMYREAYAHVPQSTIGDYLHQALLRIEYSYIGNARVIQEGFDSIVVECQEDKADEIDRYILGCFDKKLFWKGIEFSIPADGKRGHTWGKK